ncbi:hypothetical protein AB0J21_15220 [Streptomyces sp. NPDC049954]|uniref:hypothetical protein n=1 Tax=Streptomyces sp. NPDC049954 TaxID=3155779 RepID=UPI00343D9E25
MPALVPLGPNFLFGKGGYTMADLVLTERSQAADADDSSKQAHIPAKIGYTTPRDTIRESGRALVGTFGRVPDTDRAWD